RNPPSRIEKCRNHTISMPMAAKPDRASAIAVSATLGSALRPFDKLRVVPSKVEGRLSLRASRATSRDGTRDSRTATPGSALAAVFRAADFEERVRRFESRTSNPESRVERYHAPAPAHTLHATA